MEFTGERFIPGQGGYEIAAEHLNRYQAASHLVEGLVVIDIASGAGYGSALLSEKAKQVYGVDIDPEAVAYAQQTYGKENLSFSVGSVSAIPFADHMADAVVSFETVEHVDEVTQKAFIKEVARVLKEDGFFIISTPDRKVSHGQNHFHVHELNQEEFRALLQTQFTNVQFFYQDFQMVNVIQGKDNHPFTVQPNETVSKELDYSVADCSLFWIAVCSNQSRDLSLASAVLPGSREIIREKQKLIEWGNALDADIVTLKARIKELEAEGERLLTWGNTLDTDILKLKDRIQELEKENEHLLNWGKSADADNLILKDRVKELEAEAARLLNWGNSLDQDILVLKARINDLEAERARLLNWGKSLDENMVRLRACVDVLTTQNNHLEDRQVQLLTEVDQMRSRAYALEDEKRNLEREVNELQSRHEATVQKAEEEKRALLQEAEELRQHMQSAKEEYNALVEMQGRVASLEHELRVRESELKHIQDSDMYKFSLKYYKVRDKLFPEDSLQNRAMKKMLRGARSFFQHKVTMPLAEPRNQLERLERMGKFSRMDLITTRHTMFIARLLKRYLDELGIECNIHVGQPETYEDIPYIIICPQFVQTFPQVYFVFQLEQTISSRWFTKEYFVSLQNSCGILDYSLENVDFFHRPENRDVTSRVYYLPVDYYPNYTDEPIPEEKEYDVVFYGDANSCARRREILDELSKHFKVKICSELFGEDVYREIRKAKVLVNIHYYDGALLETTRLYETLSLNSCVIVSEDSQDASEQVRLKDIVDFVKVNDVTRLIKRVEYWVTHDEERRAKIAENQKKLTERSNAFGFYFLRFLLAHDRVDFDTFYRQCGDFVQLHSNCICLNLPESVDRRRAFKEENKYGFKLFPGLRHRIGWVGCGLSYKFIFQKAKEAGMGEIMICEDDVIFPADFKKQLTQILNMLHQEKRWDMFSGIMANVNKVKRIIGYRQANGKQYVVVEHMMSMVFNIYNQSIFRYFCKWDPTNRDAEHNTIDRNLEKQSLRVFVQVPFLVGHKEELNSTIWGFSNIEYSQLIRNAEQKLLDMAQEQAQETKGSMNK